MEVTTKPPIDHVTVDVSITPSIRYNPHTGTAVYDWKDLISKCVQKKRAQSKANVNEKLLPAFRFKRLRLSVE